MGCGHVFQRVQRLFGLALLHHAHHGVQDDDQQDQHRLEELLRLALHAGDGEGNDRRSDQDEDHHILELIGKALQIGFLFLFLQLVFAVLGEALLRLLGSKPLLQIGIQLTDDRIRSFMVVEQGSSSFLSGMRGIIGRGCTKVIRQFCRSIAFLYIGAKLSHFLTPALFCQERLTCPPSRFLL